MDLTELESWLEYSHSPDYPGDPHSMPANFFHDKPNLSHEYKIELFRDYLDTMEDYLEQERQKKRAKAQEYQSWAQSELTKAFNRLEEAIKAGHISSDPETVSMHEQDIMQEWSTMINLPEEYWIKAVDEFADTFRKSFFVNLFGFWESQLLPLCTSLKHYDDYSGLELRDENGKFTLGIAKGFLWKIRFPLDNSKTWSDINRYKILRNCIVHCNGKPSEMHGKKDQEKIEELLFSKTSFLALNGEKPKKYRDIYLDERDAVLIQEGKPKYFSKKSIIKAESISFRKGDVVLSPEKAIAIFTENPVKVKSQFLGEKNRI